MSRPSASATLVAATVIVGLGIGSGLIGLWSASRTADEPTGSSGAMEGYPSLLSQAGDHLESQVAVDGPGLSFDVTQRQFLRHVEGAPPILVEPAPSASPVEVEELFTAGYMTRGFLHGEDFLAEIRSGLPETGPPDFAAGEMVYTVLIDDGAVWRDHGDGWFEVPAEAIPGNGIDPFSLSRLPGLLKGLTDVEDAGTERIDGQTAHRFVGLGESADWPGIIVPDGLLFTASPIGVEAWVGEDGRLLRLRGQTANLNEQTQSGVIVTEIDFGDDVPEAMPAPSPLLVQSTPEPDPSTPATSGAP